MENTNMDFVRKTGKMFARLPMKNIEGMPSGFIVQHPFLTSAFILHEKGLADLRDEKAMSDWLEMIDQRINACKTVGTVFSLINKPFKLAFFKAVSNELNDRDFARELAEAWTQEEFPSKDPNCSIAQLVKWFKKADPTFLMTDEERAYLANLPKSFTVYRGVSAGAKRTKGLSWTDELSTAVWFSQRFSRGLHGKKAVVFEATINKEDVLAFFSRRGENEFLLDTRKIKYAIYENRKEVCGNGGF